MHKGVPMGEMVSDRKSWPPMLSEEEFVVLEELVAERVVQRKAKEPEPESIEVGQLWECADQKQIIEVEGHVGGYTGLRPVRWYHVASTGQKTSRAEPLPNPCPKAEFRSRCKRLPYRREASR